ncbi:MAG: GDCCVxC domain-containing (seleno)protein [Alphaproteobacteria bacterium]
MKEQVDNNLRTGNVIELRSVVTCPNCRHEQSEAMPVDSCLLFYSCRGCGVTLRPTTGDCCIFCTFGSVACPPKQKRTMNMA